MTQFGIVTNGFIQFGAGPYSTNAANVPLPSNILGSAIALVWDDWVADPGDITYQTVGSAPNRQLVVCFNNIVHFSGGGRVINNGRIILYESTNVFEVHLDGNQTSGTQGYQLNSGTGTTIRNGSFTSTNARRVTPTPTCTYAWSTGATTASIAANSPGTYVVTTTDGQGCTASASASFIPVNATLTGGTNFCDQGTLTANVSGGTAPFAYSWSNGRTTAANAVNSSGTYSLSITDAGGCSTTLTTNVTVNPRPSLSTASTGASCNGNNGSVNLSVTGTGPFGFGWNNGATTEDLGGLAAGSYTVTVQGAGGCTATAAATVGTLPDAVAPTFSVCPGSQTLSMGANCGAALPNYLPNAAAADNCGTPTVTQSPAPGTAVAGIGNTTVTLVATDASGNTASCSFTVQRTGGTPLATATPTSPGCGGGTGSISLSVTGGATPYTYLWNDGTTAVNRTGLAAGTYAVTATDACGSTATAAANIIFTAVSASATGTATPCNANSGAVNLTLGGNGPFVYTWNNGATTEDLGGLAAGSYTVTVQGAGGCTATASATVGALPDAVAPTFSVCPGNSDTMSTVSIALPDFTAFAAASDNCGTPNLQQVPAAGTVYAQSQNVTITMTATDASGNSTVCTFTYQIGIFSCLPVGNVIYVNDNATGANNGDSWQNAFTDLQNGLAAAASGDQIWVAEGTYYPGSQPSSVFDLRAGVAMYGGFPDNLTCPDLQVRDWNSYPTVLSGDIGVPGDASDNCARILQANNIGSSTIVDGFRIASGNAPIQGAGLGITANNGVSSPAFENCTFSGNSAGNRGAAVYVFATASGQAAPTFVNCIFSQNNSTTEGGAIAAISQLSGVLGLSISGGQFIGNTSQRGGALSANAVSGGTLSLQVTETQFEANSATSNGGAIWLNGRSGGTLQYSVQDAQFNGNTAQNGAAMFAQTLGSSMTGTVARSRFTANQSTGYAALTIYAEKGVPVNGLAVENCIFESNKSGRGGGLAAVSLSGGRTNAQVRSSLFRGNSGVGGGALFTAQNANAQTAGAIENSVFASNTSFSKGGGLVAQALNGGVTNIQVSFCDFYANLSGYGGSAANLVQGASNSNISLNNSIFSENVTLFLGAKNFRSEGAGAVTSLQSSIVEQALCANNHSGTGTFSCSGIVAQNPGWSDPVNGDFSLLPNSPAIDQAVSGPSSDFNGNPRPAGAGYDWGAFEWQTPAAPARMSAPKNALSAAIFPNPNAGNFSVLFDRAVTGMLQVFDARGAMVAAQNVTGVDRAEMDLGKLPAGPYWVRIVADSEVLTLVVVLQKP